MPVQPAPSQRSPDAPDKRATPRGGARSTAARRQKKFRQRPTLPHGNRAVPSALEGLTSVFGMGTGGPPPIKPPETLHMRKRRVVAAASCAALDPGLIDSVKQLEEKNDQAARAISIGQLNA